MVFYNIKINVIDCRRNRYCCIRCYFIISDYWFGYLCEDAKKRFITYNTNQQTTTNGGHIRYGTSDNSINNIYSVDKQADRFVTIDNDIFYKCKGGSLVKLPKRFPQVGVLNNYIFYLHEPTDFIYLEKTDGEHTLLLIDDNDIYKLSTSHKLTLTLLFSLSENDNINHGFSLLDAEFYNNQYYVFDAYAVDNVLIYDYNLIDRLKQINEFIDSFHNKNLLNNIHVKQTYKVTKENINEIINMVNTLDYSRDTSNKIDGVVFQLVNSPYVDAANQPVTFKLKRRTLNTIDFMLKYNDKKKIYFLYLQNKLFRCPYYYNLHKLDINKLTKEWNHNGYNNEQITEINELISDMMNNPKKYNNTVVEMSLTYSNYWVPLRVRQDKVYSNSYKVGILNTGVIFSPLTMNESYFTSDFSKSPFDDDIRVLYHEVNKYIREYMFEQLFSLTKQHDNKQQKSLSLLDVCGGRGGDVEYYLPNGVTDIFTIDSDKMALTQYVESYYDKCVINARYTVLSNNTDNTNKLINHIQRYKPQFDIIVVNYAIHYLCDDDNKIINLGNIIRTLLKPGGLVLISYFDGDKLLAKLPIKHFEGIKPCDDDVHCLMALPTIDPTGYRYEPLVKQHHIDILTNDKNNKPLKIIKEFYPLENLTIDHKELINDVSDYLVNIKTIILTH